ncbi:MAG TPA: tetratricopeptide repeat protein [Methylibium sp.]|uniref:YfgM family protein n=1 Tax=Methylibium sp. TaxID=2067992 RepID=UPI002DBB66BB|nr:tetratricopeptide repeat protein [Methylibium sp.]HEU4460228.1 tetratricopeptide repeat protein [Methylibium sp.]
MATHLDLEEQEQLDALKHFWKRYGGLITWALIAVLGIFAAYNGWQWYERDRSAKAALLFDEIDRAAQAGDLDRASRGFGDMKERYASTTFASQAALLLAKLQFDKGQPDAARTSLEWVARQGGEQAYPIVAKLRLAGVLLDQKKYDEALKALPADAPPAFAALAEDRRGDILAAQGKKDEAIAAYRKAWTQIDPALDYRRLVDAKLTALGAAPSAPAASAPAAGASR